MREAQKELDIAKNIKKIEWLKSELLDNISGLFRGFLQGSQLLLKDCLANIVVLCYLLARRLGIQYTQFEDQIVEKIRHNREVSGKFEGWEEELGILEHQFQSKK